MITWQINEQDFATITGASGKHEQTFAKGTQYLGLTIRGNDIRIHTKSPQGEVASEIHKFVMLKDGDTFDSTELGDYLGFVEKGNDVWHLFLEKREVIEPV